VIHDAGAHARARRSGKDVVAREGDGRGERLHQRRHRRRRVPASKQATMWPVLPHNSPRIMCTTRLRDGGGWEAGREGGLMRLHYRLPPPPLTKRDSGARAARARCDSGDEERPRARLLRRVHTYTRCGAFVCAELAMGWNRRRDSKPPERSICNTKIPERQYCILFA